MSPHALVKLSHPKDGLRMAALPTDALVGDMG